MAFIAKLVFLCKRFVLAKFPCRSAGSIGDLDTLGAIDGSLAFRADRVDDGREMIAFDATLRA